MSHYCTLWSNLLAGTARCHVLICSCKEAVMTTQDWSSVTGQPVIVLAVTECMVVVWLCGERLHYNEWTVITLQWTNNIIEQYYWSHYAQLSMKFSSQLMWLAGVEQQCGGLPWGSVASSGFADEVRYRAKLIKRDTLRCFTVECKLEGVPVHRLLCHSSMCTAACVVLIQISCRYTMLPAGRQFQQPTTRMSVTLSDSESLTQAHSFKTHNGILITIVMITHAGSWWVPGKS